jgi:hypothetical protein
MDYSSLTQPPSGDRTRMHRYPFLGLRVIKISDLENWEIAWFHLEENIRGRGIIFGSNIDPCTPNSLLKVCILHNRDRVLRLGCVLFLVPR